MKLYTKNLTSLAALRQERQRLKAANKATTSNMLDNNSVGANSDTDNNFDFAHLVNAGIDILSSKTIVDRAMAIGMPLLNIAGIRLEKKLIKTVGKELLFGYLKWKAVEIGLRTTSTFIEQKRNKLKD